MQPSPQAPIALQLPMLLDAKAYRQFLRILLTTPSGHIPRGLLSKISYRAGFSSRSFMTELLQGKKRLTPRSLPKVCFAIGLKGALADYFELLVALEEPDIRDHLGMRRKRRLSSDTQILDQLSHFATRLRQDSQHLGVFSRGVQPRPQLSLSIICTYAALGSPTKGASLSEIAKRTSMSSGAIKAALKCLQEAQFVSYSAGRFFAKNRSLDFSKLRADAGFIDAIREVALEIGNQTQRLVKNEQNLLLLTAVPIAKDRREKFKEALRSAVLDVVDEFQDDESVSAEVMKIVLGSFSR